MDRMVMKVWTTDDKEHVGVQLEQNDKALGYILFDGASAEQHMHNVARHRAELNDGVAPDLDPGARLEAIVDPTWRTPKYRLQEGRILSFRHPGLGWLTFVVPDKEAASIAEWLTKDLPLRKAE
jgi:hypothetical protein